MQPAEIRETIFDLLWEVFKGDEGKIYAWLNTFNPNLYYIPYDMLYNGREKKLLAFIQSCKEDNRW